MNRIDKIRFNKKYKKSNDCWNWTACVDSGGYGMFRINGKSYRVPRLMWEITHGPINDSKMYVCHKCDNRRCLNPKHLFLGTCKENIQDMWRKGRDSFANRATGIRNGKYTKPECTPRGEKNGQSKLTVKDVLAIRTIYKPGFISMHDLAKRYNVDAGNINCILKRKTWAHV